ncbi:Reverse transcriptase (RNA-dependent DNA polymerase) [Fragilaria crotonensis]|nr:Reverse transcriptase (RNA-dependent DNA polymerase) [Fragilaria crotonensis]
MDEYISASVLLPRGEDVVRAKVIGRMHGRDGTPLGMRHSNPILDTREYQVEFPDGSTATYAANVIAENLYSQVDDEGRHFAILQEITDHKKDGSALSKDDGFIENRHGQRRPKLTTRGWKLLVSWKDGTSDWIPLKDLKEANPVEVAEYAVANKIAEEPAFAWWVCDVLRRRDRVIKKVKSTKYWLRSHKYGVELPKTVAEALAIDRRTGTTFWRDAIEKEMRNVMIAFEFSNDPSPPVGFAKATCHMIFDIKFDLTRKARLVLNGAKHDVPKEMTFSSVVSRDSVRIAFTLAALNGLDILAADIQNAYLSAPTEERLYVVAGLEFPPDLRGRPAKIVRALYGMKSSGARFRDHLAASLRDMGYKSCKADPDNVMDALSKVYKLKDGSVKAPDVYLGAEIKQFRIPESDEPGKIRWAMSSSKYVARAVKDVETELENVGLGLPKRTTTPLSQGYRPELDQTAELDAQRLNYYQGLVGVLRWICELGRVDILMPVSLMSRYLVSAREGHLQQLFHVFAYLKQYDRSTMVFDDTEPSYDPRRFATQDWSKYYPDAKEAIPENMPEPRGKPVMMTCFVDADHAGFELIEGLRYKLRMMGVPVEDPCNVFCDNEAVVKNSTRPESTLKKKHQAIAYHRTREAQAAGTVRIAKEDGETNLADIFTKLLAGPKLRDLLQRILW